MKIEPSLLGYKIIDSSSDSPFHISNEMVESVKKKVSVPLENMLFNTSLADGIWEISAPIPNGTGEAVASVIPYMIGRLQKQDDGIIICTHW